MTDRSVERILAEWRSAQAALDRAPDDTEAVRLAERIAGLQAEHTAAMAGRADVVDELGHGSWPSDTPPEPA